MNRKWQIILVAAAAYAGMFVVAGADAVDPDNPYEKETLVVSIDDAKADGDVQPLVRKSLDYWENNSEEYAGHPIEYEIQPDATVADVHITFEDNIHTCGPTWDMALVGCADQVESNAPDTVSVEIESGHTSKSTLHILKHEIGHTLGLTHEDKPHDVMAFEYEGTQR